MLSERKGARDLLPDDAKKSPWLWMLRWDEPVGAGDGVSDSLLMLCAVLTCFANACLLL